MALTREKVLEHLDQILPEHDSPQVGEVPKVYIDSIGPELLDTVEEHYGIPGRGWTVKRQYYRGHHPELEQAVTTPKGSMRLITGLTGDETRVINMTRRQK